MITPPRPVALSVYGDRTAPFDSVVAAIHAKALALEHSHGHEVVIVAADLIGFQVAIVTASGIVASTVSTTVRTRAFVA